MRKGLVIFSPLPPVKNGIADYVRRLIDHHAKVYDCVAVIADHAPTPVDLPPDVLVLRDREYRLLGAELGGLTHLFHVGNNPDHVYMLDHLSTVSGIVVLHDLTLHHLVSSAYYYEVADRRPYERLVRSEHGAAGGVLVEQDRRLRWRSPANYSELPVLGAVLRNASAVIVHSWMGVLRAQSCQPEIVANRIEHFADVPKTGRIARRLAARARLGLPPDANVLLSLGFVTAAKQLGAVMSAIALIERETANLIYVVVGEERELSLRAEAEKRRVSQFVRNIGYSTEEELSDYLDAADIFVNLRFPTGGETSGSLSRALGLGVCSVVSDHGWYAELPDNAVVKIPPSSDPTSMLAGVLLMLLKDPQKRRSYENSATAWAAGRTDVIEVAKSYHSVIDTAAPRPVARLETRAAALSSQPSIAELAAIVSDHSTAIEDANDAQFAGRLWLSEGLVPAPEPGGSLLVSGPGSLRKLVERLTGCRCFLDAGQTADIGLFVGSWAEASEDGARLSDFCDAFVDQGVAGFNFWDSEAGGGKALSAKRVERLLATFGFEVVHLITKSATPLIAISRFPPVVEIAVLARRALASGASSHVQN